MTTNDEMLWYAAFGSNLLRERFLVYLTGGTIPGSTTGKVQAGARNPALPSGDQPFAIQRTMVFAGASPQWGNGGTAAVDHDQDPTTPTLGRAFRISLSQFEDVVAQENRLAAPPSIDLAAAVAGEWLDVSPNKYGRVALVGRIEDEPVLTITTLGRPANLTPAHNSYLAIMASGLEQTWGLGPPEAAEYLSSRPGNFGHVDPVALAEYLTG